MASLAGKADSTIVAAAYRASMENVPKDNLTSITIDRNAYKSVMDNVEGIFKGIQDTYEANNQELKDLLQPIMDASANGTFDSVVTDQVSDDLKSFKTEWKSFPKGEKGEKQRLAWRSKVNKYTNSLSSESENLSTIANSILNNSDNIQATGDNYPFLNTIYKYQAGKEGGATRTSVNGVTSYTAVINGVSVTKTMPEIMESVVPKDLNAQTQVAELTNSIIQSGASGVVDEMDEVEVKSSLNTIMNNSKQSKKTFLDFIGTSHPGMEKSIIQEIHSFNGEYTDAIFGYLNKNQYLQKYDTGTDGLDKKDFEGANEKKYLELARHVTSANDFKLSKDIAFDIYAKGLGKTSFKKGEEMFKKQQEINKGAKGDYLQTSFGSQSKVRANLFVQNILNKKSTIQDLKGNEFVLKKDGKYHSIAKDEDGKTVVRDAAQMFEANEMDGYYNNDYKKTLEMFNMIDEIPDGGGGGGGGGEDFDFTKDPNYTSLYDLVGDSGFNSKTLGGQEKVLKGLTDLYPDFIFTSPRKDKLEVRRKDGKGGFGIIEMNRYGKKRKNESIKKLFDFINLEIDDTTDDQSEEIKGRTQESIAQSKARGEVSKFNTGKDGKMLPEGYTMNDEGKIIWVKKTAVNQKELDELNSRKA